MKKYLLTYFLAGVLILGVLAACGKTEYKAVAINEGVDKCEICQMLIKDDQYATQIILKDQKPLKFDDLGDLYVWLNKNGRDNVGAAFVRDYYSKEWINLDQAVYVYDKAIKTPMSFGVVSFAKEADADKFIKEAGAGAKMTAKELDSHDWAHTMGGGHGGM
ncbi:MAG: putative lipoprotein [Paenibacillaceae bacterium]|jgi:copper chaperone NosL|nr:putative lipoprotein [Paenibacillaceae bacterium]